MKEKTKLKLKMGFHRFLATFALYALLPLISGAVIGLLFLIRAQGAGGLTDAFQSWGEKSVFAVIGSAVEKRPVDSGFYFLTGEVTPPLAGGISMTVGSAHYFSPLTPTPPTEEKTAEIIYDSLPAGATPVIRADLSSPNPIINTTKYTVDLEKARSAPFPSSVAIPEEGPLVLVLHTHATEGYFEDNTNLSDFAVDGVESYFLESQTSFRTTDPEKSVVQVGKVFSDTLNTLGIPTLHCQVQHDAQDFNSAYVNAAETVKKMLAQYPTIQYVIDLHRDSVVRGDQYVKSYTEIEGKKSAQVMLVVGTNQNGRHPNWENNLVVACAFKDQMDSLYPTLSRSMYLRTARFNQEYLPGCMLLEVGSAANSLEEAQEAARMAADAFYHMLKAKQ